MYDISSIFQYVFPLQVCKCGAYKKNRMTHHQKAKTKRFGMKNEEAKDCSLSSAMKHQKKDELAK